MSAAALPPIPEDFEEFWTVNAAEALHAPLDYHREVKNCNQGGPFVVNEIQFRSIEGRTLNGWIAFPEGARRLRTFLWLPPYGRESVRPNAYGTREGFTSMSFNFHGEPAFHRETYSAERGYFADGAEAPETWIFRRMFQNALIAIRVLQTQIEVDEDRIATMGMSQGGGMSIWLGAWCSIVKAVCADMPFLSRISETLSGKVYRYPLKELFEFMEELPIGRERVMHTVSYYDTVYQAAYCHKPTHVSLGEKDPAARPPQVRSVFEALPGPKELTEYPVGHEWTTDMIAVNRDWLLRSMP